MTILYYETASSDTINRDDYAKRSEKKAFLINNLYFLCSRVLN